MSTDSIARRAALEAIIRCRRDKAWSGASINAIVQRLGMDHREAALASRIALGVMQNTSLCDYYISCYCKSKLEPKLRDILRMGVYQILFLDRIPDHAAVSESVELCRINGLARAAGLANAVLRRIAAEKEMLPAVPGQGTAAYLSIRYSHPLWLCEELIELKGYDFAEAFLRMNNEEPKLSLQINTLKVSADDYMRALKRADIDFEAGEPQGSVLLPEGIAAELPGYEDGLFYVQDRAARTAVELAAPEPGMKVLDACASPGGKSFAAAICMNDRGSVLSCDVHEKKLGMIERGAKRLGVRIIQTRAMDARHYDPALDEAFDLVIADVPCSGLGVIAKKPEIRDRDPEALKALPEIQTAILENLSRYVRPGGVLLYSTCTVLPRENEEVVRRFLLKHGQEFSAEDFALSGITSREGMYTFWPNVDGTDGFFAAKLRKSI